MVVDERVFSDASFLSTTDSAPPTYLFAMDSTYDREQVSRSLQESAKLAEWFYRAHVQDGLRDTNAASKRDELLARMLVFKHLQEGDFLQDRDLLLAELRWLLKNERPLAPRHALDAATFARFRGKLLQQLIARFQSPDESMASASAGAMR